MSVRTSWMLAGTRISPSTSCLSFETSSTTSPPSTVVLFHSGSSSDDEMTYLGMPFSLSASPPPRDGHREARNSYVRRPYNSASAPSVSSSRTWPASLRSVTLPTQPPRSNPSSPDGSWMTPSSVTFSLTTIFPISVSFVRMSVN